MTVVTRSQSKATNEMKASFIKDLTYLIYCCDEAVGKNRMEIWLEILKLINRDLPIIIERNPITNWLNFVLTLRDKVDELRKKITETWFQYDKTLAKTFHKELYKAKILTISTIGYRTLP